MRSAVQDCQALLRKAVQRHQAGAVDEAEQMYAAVLEAEPRQPDALHLLGLVHLQRGDAERAVELLRAAIEARPRAGIFHFNLGVALEAQGRLAEAVESYERASALDPAHAEALLNLGYAQRRLRRLDKAAISLRRALAVKPDLAAAWLNLGDVLWAKGELEEALKACRQALALDPAQPRAYVNLGNVLRDRQRFEEAQASYRQAIALDPNCAAAHSNLGALLRERERLPEALHSLERAVAIDPNSPDAHSNLGNVLQDMGRLDEATAAQERALALDPGHREAHLNLGNALQTRWQLQAALAHYEQALTIDPGFAAARWCRSYVLLLRGEFEEGLAEHEQRLLCPPLAPGRDYGCPVWRGESLEGKTILLHSEQGFGDTLQFVRYAPVLRSQGAMVVVACQSELATLLRASGLAGQVVGRDEQLPPFDLQASLLSLPHVLGTRLDSIPAEVPYVHADPERVRAWRSRLPGTEKRKIGLAWAGNPGHKNDRHRSLPAEAARRLAQLSGAELFGLQKGARAADLSADLGFTSLEPLLTDFSETAAALMHMDLVITVDTAVAHLAGALGRPVWVLLAMPHDWRWLLDRPDSPWYPTARLFRQHSPGDWTVLAFSDFSSWEMEPSATTSMLSLAALSASIGLEPFSVAPARFR
ncbi:MAG TPA: tetratricopeptide repeat protein [Chloroflexota bacterium]